MPGQLVIISSPSGGGKDTVIASLLKKFPRSAKIITTTTRSPREGEQDKISFYFTDKAGFENKIKNSEMVEYNFYADNYYGVSKQELMDKLRDYDIVFTNVDVNGRHNIDKAGFDHISIFLVPDDMEMIKERLKKRGHMDQSELDKRLSAARSEIARANEYNHQIINKTGQLEETIDKSAKIINDCLQNHT